MLRRSNSSSHIPIAKTSKSDVRPRSRSTARSSIKDPPKSNFKIVRAGSVEKLSVPGQQKPQSLLHFKKSLATPTLSGPRPSTSTVTPASSKRAISPFKYGSAKSDRLINDKKWVSEQFFKVRMYLQEHPNCQQHIPDTLKPPTINTFVYVINLLFKELDNRIEINLANYKDEVLKRLKGMRYPGAISLSFLKTVNTMHAWPLVISVFSWLIDIINIIHPKEIESSDQVTDIKQQKIECITNFLIKRYSAYNKDEDETLANEECIAEMERIMNVKVTDLEVDTKKLEEETKELNIIKEKQLEKIRSIENTNSIMKKEIDELVAEIDTYYAEHEQKQLEVEHVNEKLKQRKVRLAELIKIKKENISKLEQKLKEQPCSYEDKVKLTTHVEEMKHTLDLKKENLAAKKEYKNLREMKLTEMKKTIETHIYSFNKEIMKLTMIKPELKVLQLSESDFISKEFLNELNKMTERKEVFAININHEIESLKLFISKIKSENNSLSVQTEDLKNEIKSLNEKEREIDENIGETSRLIKNKLKEHENEKKLIFEKIQKLKENEPDLQSLKQELNQVLERKKEKEEQLENTMKETKIFFDNLQESFMDHLKKKNEIRTEIFDYLVGCLHNIDAEQEHISEDLKTLNDLKENKK